MTELLPCQVSDAMIEIGQRLLRTPYEPRGRQTSTKLVSDESLASAYAAMNTASTIPTDGEATQADFDAIAGMVEHAKQFNPPSCYVQAHLFEPLNRIIATAHTRLSTIPSAGELRGLLGNIAQMLDEMKAQRSQPDSLPWTDWNQSQRDELSRILASIK